MPCTGSGMNSPPVKWYHVVNVDDVASPALLVYPERIEANVRKMVAMAGSPQRLRPHIKTHKSPEIIRIQQAIGINQFKCATIAEAEMAAGCGAEHVVLAYQPVGPNIPRLLDLKKKFPATQFATVVDNAATLVALGQAAHSRQLVVEVLLDIDCGMGRTGIAADSTDAPELYRLISTFRGVKPGGLHAYDGHIVYRDPKERAKAAEDAIAPTHALRAKLVQQGFMVPRVVVGGTPTFPTHVLREGVECSPGTSVLWDSGYATEFLDLDFVPAAVVLARVVSKPAPNRLCLDLGYKAIASETVARVQLLELPEAVSVLHSEEHLVVETAREREFAIGDAVYGIPWHICPTVALHSFAVVVRRGRADAHWKIVARERTLTI
jgi:D-serine deaminase-like pyridoxal phosphate-dependent protein